MTSKPILLSILFFILGAAATYMVIALIDSEESFDGEASEISVSKPREQIKNYLNWIDSGLGPREIQLEAYNINANLLKAIEKHKRTTIWSHNVRTYYALEKPTTDSFPPIYMVVFPLNELCYENKVSDTDKVYRALMSPEFSLPCPKLCD